MYFVGLPVTVRGILLENDYSVIYPATVFLFFSISFRSVINLFICTASVGFFFARFFALSVQDLIRRSAIQLKINWFRTFNDGNANDGSSKCVFWDKRACEHDSVSLRYLYCSFSRCQSLSMIQCLLFCSF